MVDHILSFAPFLLLSLLPPFHASGIILFPSFLSRRLVVQRTKRIDDTQELLLKMLEDLTSGTDQERQEFMTVCVDTLKRFRKSDMITPVYVFERLCNIIHPVSPCLSLLSSALLRSLLCFLLCSLFRSLLPFSPFLPPSLSFFLTHTPCQ